MKKVSVKANFHFAHDAKPIELYSMQRSAVPDNYVYALLENCVVEAMRAMQTQDHLHVRAGRNTVTQAVFICSVDVEQVD